MEIKSKLFTTIAQALDKLKKQFDNTDKSLDKTKTTLDETIVNIDNVVDSVARTMTEALDPYFVDIIYGYKDDNGKFKLGIIKDPWKDIDVSNADINVIIPNNTIQLYHWTDIDIFSNITRITALFRDKNIIINLDIPNLFPNLQEFGFRALYNTSINELIIPIDTISIEAVIDSCIINELVFDYRNNTFDGKDFPYNGIRYNTINSLKIINTPLDSVITFPQLYDNDFKFNSTNDIKGWEYVTRLNPRTFNFSWNKIDEIYIHSGITIIDALFIIGPMIERPKISILSLEGANKRITNDLSGAASNVKDFKIDGFENLSTYTLDVNSILLSNKYINYENLYIGDELITDTLEIPETVTRINDYIFSGNTHIKNLILHDKFTYIGKSSLPTNAENIYLSSLSNYLNMMFDDGQIIGYSSDLVRKLYLNGELIENLVIPDEITELKYSAFTVCTFKTVDLNNVVDIGTYAFNRSNIEYIYGENVEYIGYNAFIKCNCNLINLPNAIHLDQYAFQYTISKNIRIPKIQTLSYGSFRYCEMDKIIIPEGVSVIPAYCFAKSKIGYIVLPSTLTNITTESDNDSIFGDNAVVYIKSITPPNITHTLNSSTHHSSYTIYVPTNSVEAYKSNTRYKNIKNRIFPYDFELNPDNIQLDYE